MFEKKACWRGGVLFVGAVALLVMGTAGAYAAPGGKGGGNGGGGGGGKGDIYSDLVLAYRDVTGLPIMAHFDTAEGTEYCVQPVSYTAIDGLTPVTNPVNGEDVWLIPLMGGTVTVAEEDTEEVEVCDPQVDYAGYVQEVDLERLNLGRSPSKVLDSQLEEVQAMLTLGDLTLEPSGRWIAGGVTIDSPLMNLAIFRELMLDGYILDANGLVVSLPQPITGYDFAHHAAVAVAMAGGKEVPVGIDAVVYFNRVLNVPANTVMFDTVVGGTAEVCNFGNVTVDETLYSTCGVSGEEYVDYGTFGYDRATTYPGCATYYPVIDGVPQQATVTEPILDIVFAGLGASGAGLDGVGLQADDARQVNLWTHDMGDILLVSADPLGVTTCPAE